MYLIDTVVLSELRKPKRDARLTTWIERQRTIDLFVSVVTIGEIERGIARQRTTDPDFAAALRSLARPLVGSLQRTDSTVRSADSQTLGPAERGSWQRQCRSYDFGDGA